MVPADGGRATEGGQKRFCGEVVILGFKSELKKDYGRLSKGPQKVGLKKWAGKGVGEGEESEDDGWEKKNAVKGDLERMGEDKFFFFFFLGHELARIGTNFNVLFPSRSVARAL
jgi:hypothetical protein